MPNRHKSHRLATRQNHSPKLIRQQLRNLNNPPDPTQASMMPKQLSSDALLMLIPQFDGKKGSDIEFFLKQFAEIYEKSKNTKLIILWAKIVGPVKDRLAKNLELDKETNYNTFREKLIKFFQAKTSFQEAQANFFLLKQTADQSVREFINEFKTAAKLYVETSGQSTDTESKFIESIKLSCFLESVRPDFSLDLRPFFPKHFNEACQKAIKLEEMYCRAPNMEINNIKTNDNSKLLNELIKLNLSQSKQIEQVVREINNLKFNTNQTPNDKPVKIFCKICKRKSHSANDCWFRSNSQNNRPNNGRGGHNSNQRRQQFNNRRQNDKHHHQNFDNYNKPLSFQSYPTGNGLYGFLP